MRRCDESGVSSQEALNDELGTVYLVLDTAISLDSEGGLYDEIG
jgi:hypothetical protein